MCRGKCLATPPYPEDFGLSSDDARRATAISKLQNRTQIYAAYLFRTTSPTIGVYLIVQTYQGAEATWLLVSILFGMGCLLDRTLGQYVVVPAIGSRIVRSIFLTRQWIRYEKALSEARAHLEEREARESLAREREKARRDREQQRKREQQETERLRRAKAERERQRQAQEAERKRREDAQRRERERAQAEAERQRQEQQRQRKREQMEALRRKNAWLQMDGYQFENAVAELFEALGWEVERRGKAGDNGVDLTVRPKGTQALTIVQCKAHKSRLSKDTLRALQGVREDFEYAPAIIACFYGPTQGGMDYANRKNIQVYDVDRLVEVAMSLES